MASSSATATATAPGNSPVRAGRFGLVPEISRVGTLAKQLSSSGGQRLSGSTSNSINTFAGASKGRQHVSEEASVLSGMNSAYSGGSLPPLNLQSMHCIIHHPISAGFLFQFCESQYCSESIRFIIAVDKFREYMSTLPSDCELFTSMKIKSWKALDKKIYKDFKGIGSLSKAEKDEIQLLLDNRKLLTTHPRKDVVSKDNNSTGAQQQKSQQDSQLVQNSAAAAADDDDEEEEEENEENEHKEQSGTRAQDMLKLPNVSGDGEAVTTSTTATASTTSAIENTTSAPDPAAATADAAADGPASPYSFPTQFSNSPKVSSKKNTTGGSTTGGSTTGGAAGTARATGGSLAATAVDNDNNNNNLRRDSNSSTHSTHSNRHSNRSTSSKGTNKTRSGYSPDACRTVILDMVKSIWDEFLSDSAPYQIFVPSTVLSRTILRLKMLQEYGKDVFQEVLYDPVKTIQKDIKPRFMKSEFIKQLRIRAEDISEPAMAEHFSCPLPDDTLHQRYNYKQLLRQQQQQQQQNGSSAGGLVEFALADVLQEQLLFKAFSKYLQVRVAAENIYFIRVTQIARQQLTSDNPDEYKKGVDRIWDTYHYFIAPQACFEVSVSSTTRREIMRQLAVPHPEIFAPVEKDVLHLLKTHYKSFQATSEYAEMVQSALNYLQQKLPKKNSSAGASAQQQSSFLLSVLGGRNRNNNKDNNNNNTGNTGNTCALPAIITPTAQCNSNTSKSKSSSNNNNDSKYTEKDSGRLIPIEVHDEGAATTSATTVALFSANRDDPPSKTSTQQQREGEEGQGQEQGDGKSGGLLSWLGVNKK